MRIASSQIHCMKYFTNLSWIVLKLRPFPTDSVWNKEKGAVSPDILTGISYSVDVGRAKKDRKSIMFFQYPGDVKGTGFLTWDYDDPSRDDDKWLYLPAMKKTRRISGSSAKQDYFMGSDFTYDDMGSRHVDEDTHKLLGEESIGGHKCWQLESVPKDKPATDPRLRPSRRKGSTP